MHSSANFFEANLGIASHGSIVASEPLNVCCVALKSPTVVRTTAASPLCPARRINKSRYIVNTRGTLKARSREKKGDLADCTRPTELRRPSLRLPGTSLASPHLQSRSKAPGSDLGLAL